MDSTNNNKKNNNQMFLCEFKELRNEVSAMKKRIVQLEKSHEKQQEQIDVLERENHALKTELNLSNGIKQGGSVLKRKRTDQDHEKEIESKTTPALASTGKKAKTNTNNIDDDEGVVLPRLDNGDSFDSLSDDLLHKIVEFDGNCYSKFGSINRRCRNIYDVKEYKLKKQTYVYGHGTLDMMLERYLQKRKEGKSDSNLTRFSISRAVISHDRLDVIDWIIQLGDSELLKQVCYDAAYYGRIDILTKVFLKSNLTTLDQILDGIGLCYLPAYFGQLETLKWVRKYGAKLVVGTFEAARENGHDKIVQYLRAEGCPEPPEDRNESSVGSDVEDGDN